MTSPDPLRRVFISYSHDSPEHAEQVLSLAQRLRNEGVDAWIDRFEPHPAEGWPLWMERQMERAAFVVLVCTPTYCLRFAAKEEPGRGAGVAWEGKLLRSLLYHGDSGHGGRVVPVLFEGESADAIPLPAREFTRYQLPDDYDRLYRRLTEQPEFEAGALGLVRKLAPLAPMAARSEGMPDGPVAAPPRSTWWRIAAILVAIGAFVGLLGFVVARSCVSDAPRVRDAAVPVLPVDALLQDASRPDAARPVDAAPRDADAKPPKRPVPGRRRKPVRVADAALQPEVQVPPSCQPGTITARPKESDGMTDAAEFAAASEQCGNEPAKRHRLITTGSARRWEWEYRIGIGRELIRTPAICSCEAK